MITIKKVLTSSLAALTVVACSDKSAQSTDSQQPIKVIFETDMGNDVDDALAIDMLFKYAEQGKIQLLGISSNKRDESSTQYIDALTQWYGMPELPIGYVVDGVACNDAVDYAAKTVSLVDTAGNPLFKRNHDSDGHKMPSVEMYRRLLASQPDSSVTVISVGFSTNLAQLLTSQPDSLSTLSGSDLIAKKVTKLVMMGGEFTHNDESDSLIRHREYNVIKDIDAATAVFTQWPTPIVTSPFELGIDVCYPASSIENDFNWASSHPMVEAYKVYLPMPYDRPSWDLTSVLYAVEDTAGYFTLSPKGTIKVDHLGGTRFLPDENGTHRYLMADSIQKANILSHFVTLISTPPANHTK